MDESSLSYVAEHGIPQLLDSLAERLITKKPRDPLVSLIRFLRARHEGGYSGGVVLAGTSIGSGWMRVFDEDGQLTGCVDRVPLQSEGEMQLISACSKTQSVFLASMADGAPVTSPNTVVRRYSLKGELLDTFDLKRSIACINVDRRCEDLWVLYKGGGGVVLNCSTGAKLRDLMLPNATAMLLVAERLYHNDLITTSLWLLSPKSIERRDAETLQLDTTVHLPDSMLRPSTFINSRMHVWCASANTDGSANYCGAFEVATGKVATHLISPGGSIIAADTARHGTWHMSRQSQNGALTLMNERGCRVVHTELKRWKKANMVVDRGTGHLWLYKDDDGSGTGCRCLLYDPFQQVYLAEHLVPEVAGNTTMMIPL